MKKRILLMAMAALLAFSAAGCKSRDADNNEGEIAAADEDYSTYVTLAEYKGIEVEADRSQLEVTEDEIQSEIDAILSGYTSENQITEGVVQDGDTVNLDYSGLLDGVAFSGGTATDTAYTVGGNFIEDLDRGLIGLEIGKEYEIPCTFPENYGNEDLNGKDVIFVVTVNYIVETIYPEFTDELVKQIAEDSGLTELATTDDLRAYINDYLYENKLASFNQTKFNSIISTILDNAEFNGLPENEASYLQSNVRTNVQSQFELYGSYYGAEDVESFYQSFLAPAYGYDTYDEFVEGYVSDYLQEKMVVTLIAQAEGLSVTEDELNEYGEEFALANGYDSYEAIISEYGDEIAEEFIYTLLYQKVYDFLLENSVEI